MNKIFNFRKSIVFSLFLYRFEYKYLRDREIILWKKILNDLNEI